MFKFHATVTTITWGKNALFIFKLKPFTLFYLTFTTNKRNALFLLPLLMLFPFLFQSAIFALSLAKPPLVEIQKPFVLPLDLPSIILQMVPYAQIPQMIVSPNYINVYNNLFLFNKMKTFRVSFLLFADFKRWFFEQKNRWDMFV